MKNQLFKLTILFACIVFPCTLFSQNVTKSKSQKLDIQNRIDGTWQMCNADSTVNYNDGLVSYKIYSKGNYVLSQVFMGTNNIALAFWGIYSLENNVWDETITYTTSNVSSISGKHYLFKIKLDKDYLVINGINNQFNELWKRIK